jgi:signal transduction histidine kinase
VAAATTDEDGRPALVVSVADTGVGIAPEDQGRVFEQFGQAGDRLPDGRLALVCGLPICREIVEHHGGRLWLESAVGAGLDLLVHAPRRPATPPTPTASTASATRRVARSAPSPPG